jgi:hypothetical protein
MGARGLGEEVEASGATGLTGVPQVAIAARESNAALNVAETLEKFSG